MELSVGVLECAFVVPSGLPPPVPARLEAVLRESIAGLLEESLDRSLAGHGAVRVIRHVHADVILEASPVAAAGTDGWITGWGHGWGGASPLARSWADQLARAVVRAIEDPASDAVTFADAADQLACFVADVLDGFAGSRWYHGPMRELLDLSPHEAIAAALDRAPDPGLVLARLRARRGASGLDRLLSALPADQLRRLADDVVGAGTGLPDHGTDPRHPQAQQEHRPDAADLAVDLALQLAGELGLWTGPSWSRAAARAACGTRVVDWGSPAGPAAAVLEVLAELAVRGAVRALPHRPAGLPAHLSWLDGEALAEGLLQLPAAGDPAPARPGITSRLDQLLTDLEAVLDGDGAQRAGGSGEPGPAAALRLYAALVDRFPHWAGDLLAADTVRVLACRWRDHSAGTSGSAVPHRLDELVARLAVGSRPSPPPGALPEAMPAAGAGPDEATASLAAGVLLLLRAVQDLRLPAVIRSAIRASGRDPDAEPAAVPAALLSAAAWLAGIEDDPALTVFAGLGPAPCSRRAELLTWWPDRDPGLLEELRGALSGVLAAQGVTGPGDRPDSAAGVPETVARTLLRAWLRWLGPFAASSAPYALAEFVHRPGTLSWQPERLIVTLAPRPLDVVLDRAGYFAPIRQVGLLGGRDLVLDRWR